MEILERGGPLRLAEVFVSIDDPRQGAKVKHDLVELLVTAVAAVLCGADTFVEIEIWAHHQLDWLRKYLPLTSGIPSHDTFGRLFGLIDPEQFEAAFRRWMQSALPAATAASGPRVVAVDGKTSRRSGGADISALHLVSAFAADAGVVLGQRKTADKSNEITAIPELLATLALTGTIVTIDAMGTQTGIAKTIVERGADYVLPVKDNQPRLAESIHDFHRCFLQHPAAHTAHSFVETVDKDHGRVETRRCWAFDQIDCLSGPGQWAGLRSFAVVESERWSDGVASVERRICISSLAPDAAALSRAIRQHWSVESRLHWCMDVAFADDRMRARTRFAAHNLAVLKHMVLNLIRLDPVKRKGGIKARRFIAATSPAYREHLLGLA